MADILIVDDDRVGWRPHSSTSLASKGTIAGWRAAPRMPLQLIGERKPNLVMMDVRMPGVDGLQALEQIRADFPDVYVVIMTAYGSSQTSIDAIRNGAFDYLTKPLDSRSTARRHPQGARRAAHAQRRTAGCALTERPAPSFSSARARRCSRSTR
jgi:DNA-binding NtrC family response regulator